MTEIPEHLLKRSKERRSAMGLPGGEGDAATPSENAPAKAEPAAAKAPVVAAASKPVVAPKPKPVPAYVAAATSRRRIPFWAMPVIALLPVWGVLYYNSVTVPPVTDAGLTLGQEVYTPCVQCHGAAGQGGIGAKLNDGEVLKTFKNPKDLMMWLHLGAVGGARPDRTYGDLDREGGPHNTDTLSGVMPAFPGLSAEELAAVTRYVRETLSGEPLPDQEVLDGYETLGEDAIKDAEAGKLPSEGDGSKSDASADPPDGNATSPNGKVGVEDASGDSPAGG